MALYADAHAPGPGDERARPGQLTTGVEHAEKLGAVRLFPRPEDATGGYGARNGRSRHDLSALAGPDAPLRAALLRSGRKRPRRVTILINGYEFEPRLGFRDGWRSQPNPHNAIFHARPDLSVDAEHDSHETPWLSRLDPGADDMVIAFAVASDPGRLSHQFAGLGKAGEALCLGARCFGTRPLARRRENLFAYGYVMAGEAGACLAAVITQLTQLWGEEGLWIDIVAHSLGARVATAALRRLAQRRATEPGLMRIDQVILLAAALSTHQVSALARETWEISKAGYRAPSFQVLNFTSSADTLLRYVGAPLADRIGERIEAADSASRRAYSLILNNLPRRRRPIAGVHGVGASADWLNWIDIPLDHPQTREWGEIVGLDLAGELATCALDHWVHYTHRDNWRLYRAILTDKADWTIGAIRTGRSAGTGRVVRPPLTARPDEPYSAVRWDPDMSRRVDRSRAEDAGLV